MIMEPEWTPAGVCILGWSQNQSMFYAWAGAEAGVNIKVCAGASQNF